MKKAWMFPGQGSQEVGMGGELLETEEMSVLLRKAEEITGRPIGDIIRSGPKELLDKTSNTQVAILVVSLGILAIYLKKNHGKKPDFVVGHSAGEVAAAVMAGSMSEEEAIAFINERGLAMEEAGEKHPGGMVAILGVPDEEAERIAAENGAFVANYNIPDQQIVASGGVKEIEGVTAAVVGAGARAVRLGVSIAAHSPDMRDAVDRVKGAISDINIKDTVVPMVSNATGEIIHRASDLRDHLPNQLTKPVRWAQGVEFLYDQGVREFIEIGPRNVLQGMVKRQMKGREGVITVSAEDQITN
jgi:[acyl-carrier-protein] S-malonyltransferase